MKDMAAYRGQLSGVVVNAVVETFNLMLKQNLTATTVRSPRGPGTDTAVRACVTLAQKNARADFYFSFDQNLLLATAGAFYTKDESAEAYVQEDIACAVANVVGGRVKSFLNRQGYEFEMGPPFPVPASQPGAGDVIHVHFSYDKSGENGLAVNYVVEEKQTGSGT